MHINKMTLTAFIFVASLTFAAQMPAAQEPSQLAGVQLKEIGSEQVVSITANGPLAYEVMPDSTQTVLRFKIYGTEQGIVPVEQAFLFGQLSFSKEEETNNIIVTLALTGEFGLRYAVRLGQDANIVEIVLTTPPADTTPPVLSSIQATNISFMNAKISWQASEVVTSQVRYGVTASQLDRLAEDLGLVTNPSVSLSGLSAGTRYYYQVVSVDASGNTTSSAVKNFLTSTLKLGCNGTK